MNDASNGGRPRASARMVLFALLMLFALPIVVAWLFTIGPLEWRPAKTVNKGLLLKPAVALPTLRNAGGAVVRWDRQPDEWYLVALARPGCSEGCQELLQVTGKVRAALGKDMGRVYRTVLHAGPGAATTTTEITMWTDGSGASADRIAVAAGLTQLYQAAVIADYAGRAVLVYPPPYEGKDILRDLSRLLRVSKTP